MCSDFSSFLWLLWSCSGEMSRAGANSGLLVDWLEKLDPEVISTCPELQQKLLFALNKVIIQDIW